MSKTVPMRCRSLTATRVTACPRMAPSTGEGVAICPDGSPSGLHSEDSGRVCTSIKVATSNQTAVAAAHAPNSQRDQTVVMELIRLRASLAQSCARAWPPAIGTNTELPASLRPRWLLGARYPAEYGMGDQALAAGSIEATGPGNAAPIGGNSPLAKPIRLAVEGALLNTTRRLRAAHAATKACLCI